MQETAAPVSNNHFDVMLHALMFKYGRLAILSDSNATPKEHSDNIAETNILLFDSIFGDWPSVERRRRAGPAVSLSKNPDWRRRVHGPLVHVRLRTGCRRIGAGTVGARCVGCTAVLLVGPSACAMHGR